MERVGVLQCVDGTDSAGCAERGHSAEHGDGADLAGGALHRAHVAYFPLDIMHVSGNKSNLEVFLVKLLGNSSKSVEFSHIPSQTFVIHANRFGN